MHKDRWTEAMLTNGTAEKKYSHNMPKSKKIYIINKIIQNDTVEWWTKSRYATKEMVFI